jgi:hypothetical protein
VIRTFVLIAAVWLLLYGAAEVLGVMPPAESTRTVEDDAPDDAAGPEPTSDASEPLEVSTHAEKSAVQDDEHGGQTVCQGGNQEPRLHAARLPSGAAALLVDCGAFAELMVPDVPAARATVVARLTYVGPLLRVEAKDLTGDGHADLAFAFADRLVLLPTNAFGVWSEPTTLEGWRGDAPEVASPDEDAPPRLRLGESVFVIIRRGEARALAVESASGSPSSLRVEDAALVFRAALRR